MEAVQVVAAMVSFRDELRQWKTLLRRRDALAKAIDKQREVRIEIHLRTERDGILSSITQKYTDMPRGSDITDRTGNMVADTLQSITRADERMEQVLTDYLDVCDRITRIEAEVEMLRNDPGKPYRSVVTAFYRDGVRWNDIVSVYNVTKTTLYRWLDDAVDVIDRSMWR